MDTAQTDQDESKSVRDMTVSDFKQQDDEGTRDRQKVFLCRRTTAKQGAGTEKKLSQRLNARGSKAVDSQQKGRKEKTNDQ